VEPPRRGRYRGARREEDTIDDEHGISDESEREDGELQERPSLPAPPESDHPVASSGHGAPPGAAADTGARPPAAPGSHAPGFVPPPAVPGIEGPAPQWPPAPIAPPAWSQAPPEPTRRPVVPPPYPPATPPPSLRQVPEARPSGTARGWLWPQSLAGLAVAFAPQVLLYLAATAAGGGMTTTTPAVTVGSALLLVASSFITYGWQTFGAWLFSLRKAGGGLRAWGFRKPTAAFFWTIPTAAIAVYVVSFLHDIVVDPRQQDIVDQFPHSAGGLVLFAILAVVLAPLFEEVFFRGFLFRGFANSWGWVWGAVVSSALFSMAHLQLDVIVPLFALGFALAWVYQRTGSLWTSIALHAVFNGISVLAWYFFL
jgi:membrane protease YdiL (CAAX protease family)